MKWQARIGVNQYAIPFAACHNEAFESGSGNHREDHFRPNRVGPDRQDVAAADDRFGWAGRSTVRRPVSGQP